MIKKCKIGEKMEIKGKLTLFEAVYDNVRIRPLEERDIETLRVWRNDPKQTQYLRPIGLITPSMQKEWFQEYQNTTNEVIFAIEEIKELHQLVGSLSIYHIEGEKAEIGKIQIGEKQANGRGIGRKSMVMALVIGFQQFGLKEVFGAVSPQNIPAYKNDMEIGFEIIGQHAWKDGIEEEMRMDWERLQRANTYLNEIQIREYKKSEKILGGGNRKKVYVIDAKRTAIGKFGGAFKGIGCGELGSLVIKDILEKNSICPSDIEEVIIGNVLSAGQGQGVARQAQLLAGIPVETCAYAVNMVCGSSMKAVMNGVEAIQSDAAKVVIAGGVENMSQSPYLLPSRVRRGCRMGNIEVLDGMVWDALTDAFNGEHMGITAEHLAERYEITREEQDRYAYESHQKAIMAIERQEFEEEIVPVSVPVPVIISEKRNGIGNGIKNGIGNGIKNEIKNGIKNELLWNQDEHPNQETTLEKLKKLKPAFQKGGTITAGNASGINDGAAMLLIAEEAYIRKHGIHPLAEIIAYAQRGTDPQYMGMGSFFAVKALVEKTKISYEQIDLLELNEAFAAQNLAVIKELAKYFGVSEQQIQEKTNPKGGGIALGHPIGASGARILVTLIHTMKKRKMEYGIAALCIGGGMGTAILVRNAQFQKR